MRQDSDSTGGVFSWLTRLEGKAMSTFLFFLSLSLSSPKHGCVWDTYVDMCVFTYKCVGEWMKLSFPFPPHQDTQRKYQHPICTDKDKCQ